MLIHSLITSGGAVKHSCTSAGVGQSGRGIPKHLSSLISCLYQSTLTWNKTETSFRNLDHDSNRESGTRQGTNGLFFHWTWHNICVSTTKGTYAGAQVLLGEDPIQLI